MKYDRDHPCSNCGRNTLFRIQPEIEATIKAGEAHVPMQCTVRKRDTAARCEKIIFWVIPLSDWLVIKAALSK